MVSQSSLLTPQVYHKEGVLTVVICKDCGQRNLGSLYCQKCGSDLYARNRRPERKRPSLFDGPLVLR